jgi:hypothetical protein
MLVEIWRLAMERYAGKRGDILSLRPLDRLSIAGELEQSRADLLVSVLLRTLKYRLRKYPNRWDVHVRNFSNKHGFSPEESTPVHVPGSNKNGTHKKEERRKKKEERRNNIPTVIDSGSRKAQRLPCPDRLDPDDRARLLEWAATKGWTESHCRWAWNAVKEWSRGTGNRRVCWYSTTQGAMRRGWALEGYAETEDEKYQRELAASPLRAVPVVFDAS